jgi:hypothetical protein
MSHFKGEADQKNVEQTPQGQFISLEFKSTTHFPQERRIGGGVVDSPWGHVLRNSPHYRNFTKLPPNEFQNGGARLWGICTPS